MAVVARVADEHQVQAILAALRARGITPAARLAMDTTREDPLATALGVYEIAVPPHHAALAEQVLARLGADSPALPAPPHVPSADSANWNGPGIVWTDRDRWLKRAALLLYALLLAAIVVVFVFL